MNKEETKMASSLFSRYESAQRRWKRIKTNPEDYKKYLTYQKKIYHNKTSEQLKKESVRIKDWRRSMRRVAKDIGNCSRCFKAKDNLKFKMCLKCREKMNFYAKRKRLKGGLNENITNTNSSI